MVEELARAWIRGWTVSRGTPPPVAVGDGVHRVDVGLPGHLVRYVVPRPDGRTVRDLAERARAAGTWLKICADAERTASLLGDGWTVQDAPEYLMAVELRRIAPRTLPAGYTLDLDATGPALAAAVRTAEGAPAASGRAGLADGHAVFDQIATEPSHRRRGLGGVIMSALAAAAAARGARTGVLVATADGRALYRHLGWREVGPVTAAYVPAAD
ncbi:GNAT family N-acetyltransferase [Actinomadura parmotrematis]|uniref:GNAT family N-acetyltransferase n=1 Tax=Actinomadura parmotrematis TaxID=2864039 RepID=A0ABS7FLA8_9ACTN|nr:GNAT family N-acetyltransferase [Actinomadura parmotrematis]MBW8481139.1 GNAT family N-acetyltransferase [Actinomadura parmotrematis]